MHDPMDKNSWVSVMGIPETEKVAEGVYAHTFTPIATNPGSVIGAVQWCRTTEEGVEVSVKLTPEAWDKMFGPPWWKRMLSLKSWLKVIGWTALDIITRPLGRD